MPSRVVARKPARLIPIFPGEEPYFDGRGDIPVNSANTVLARAGLYRATLKEIVPVVNRALAPVGGIGEARLYTWVYRTQKEREPIVWENGVDEDGEAFEFVHYTGVELGDPVASLTTHVGIMIGEVPDPDVLEAVGLNRMVGSEIAISVRGGTYLVPSHKAEIAWFGEADHLRHGPHITAVVGGVRSDKKIQSGWREELEAAARQRAEKERPREVAVLRIIDVDEN